MGVLALFLVVWLAAGWSRAHLMDNLVGAAGLPTCPAQLHAAHRRHLLTTAPMPPSVRGRWISSRCETRPGPQYVLRSYTFHRDGSFLLSLHTYRDPSCAHPTRSLMARGNLTLGRPSWITPGGTEAEYTLSKVEVMGHSHQDATKLALAVNATCPGKITKPWKPHKAYVVLSYAEAANEVTEDEDCSRGLGGAWNELQLLRVEVTMQGHDAGTAAAATREEAQQEDTGGGSGMKSPKIIRKELFLGDLHTDSSKQELYRPTGYQTPLLHAKYAGACGGVCKAVERGTDDSPPHLHASPALPLLLAGSWASRRCETRPYGMFLTRHLEFSPTGHRWTMTLRHYHDP
ncbi:hypothetical protein O3P69_007970 [Scylla paramamosain]|uniref:APCDD1 domain-containing protein n=1 Tax=Scylla paramamosain TaxID=85552 RepID=A0AAW0SZF3_SCYPA